MLVPPRTGVGVDEVDDLVAVHDLLKPHGFGVFAQPNSLKLVRRPKCDARRREQRIVIAPKFFFSEICDPLRHDPGNLAPTGKKKVVKVLLYRTSRASCIRYSIKSTCFNFIEAMALSLAPVRSVNATRARLRRSISVPAGIDALTCYLFQGGRGLSRRAVATGASLSERFKKSASEY